MCIFYFFPMMLVSSSCLASCISYCYGRLANIPCMELMPLTEFANKKCKRCGFYEKDIVVDDKFDEWELCPSDFTAPGGQYIRVKEGEFNVTFICSTCMHMDADNAASRSDTKGNGLSVAIVIVISAAVTTVVIIAFVGGYRYWQKKKRQREQARFMKLFEEHDDIEDELDAI